jgi:hypothetical protein
MRTAPHPVSAGDAAVTRPQHRGGASLEGERTRASEASKEGLRTGDRGGAGPRGG